MVIWSTAAVMITLVSSYVILIALRHRYTTSRSGMQKLCCIEAVRQLPTDSMVSNPMYTPAGLVQSSEKFEGSLILLREWIELEDEIGEGFFGKVYRGRFKRNGDPSDLAYINLDGDELVAVKKLKPVNPSALNSLNDELIREASTVASFSHPNILAFRGVVFNGNAKKEDVEAEILTNVCCDRIIESHMAPWIVFEFMELGDLAELLRRMKIEETSSSKKHRMPSRQFTDVSFARSSIFR